MAVLRVVLPRFTRSRLGRRRVSIREKHVRRGHPPGALLAGSARGPRQGSATLAIDTCLTDGAAGRRATRHGPDRLTGRPGPRHVGAGKSRGGPRAWIAQSPAAPGSIPDPCAIGRLPPAATRRAPPTWAQIAALYGRDGLSRSFTVRPGQPRRSGADDDGPAAAWPPR